MFGEQNEGSELVAELTMVHVKVVGEVTDVVEVVADKHVHKLMARISRELTIEVKDIVREQNEWMIGVGGCADNNGAGRGCWRGNGGGGRPGPWPGC